MDIDKINNCYAFFYAWANAKNDPELFASLEAKREAFTDDMFKELLDNQQLFSWSKHRYRFNDPKEHLSVIGDTITTLIERAYSNKFVFENESKFKNYLNVTLNGKSINRLGEMTKLSDILTEKKRSAEIEKMQQKNFAVADSEFDKIMESSFNANLDEGTEESLFEYDEDDNHKGRVLFSIEDYKDPSEDDRQQLATLRTDVKLLKMTLVYILSRVYKDLHADLETIEKKLAWQMGLDSDVLLKYKVGFHNDHILAKYDATPLIRYMHWHNL